MLFQVTMDVRIPTDVPAETAEKLKSDERALAQELQRSGKWRHLWRIAGRYANISIFAVDSADELNSILFSLPLFPFMTVAVTALCRHPSAISEDHA
jgi:muconolactone D-isomerase